MATITEALAALAALDGFTLTAEQVELAVEASRAQCRSGAVKIVSSKAIADTDEERIEEIVSTMFDLSEMFSESIKQNKRNVRNGEHTVHMLAVDTPFGKLQVCLTVETD